MWVRVSGRSATGPPHPHLPGRALWGSHTAPDHLHKRFLWSHTPSSSFDSRLEATCTSEPLWSQKQLGFHAGPPAGFCFCPPSPAPAPSFPQLSPACWLHPGSCPAAALREPGPCCPSSLTPWSQAQWRDQEMGGISNPWCRRSGFLSR